MGRGCGLTAFNLASLLVRWSCLPGCMGLTLSSARTGVKQSRLKHTSPLPGVFPKIEMSGKRPPQPPDAGLVLVCFPPQPPWGQWGQCLSCSLSPCLPQKGASEHSTPTPCLPEEPDLQRLHADEIGLVHRWPSSNLLQSQGTQHQCTRLRHTLQTPLCPGGTCRLPHQNKTVCFSWGGQQI